MDVLKDNPVLKYHPDTLQYVRKLYDFDTCERMKDAIDILEEWIKKQEHFNVKSLPKNYLERVIINNKGSLEASKRKVDKACTFKTLMPDFFSSLNLKEYTAYKMYANAIVPTMTPDYGRIFIVSCRGNVFDPEQVLQYYKYFLLICEYMQAHDYITGITYLVDVRELNLLEFVKCMNFMDFKNVMDISIEGYCFRIKGIHLLSHSKSMEIFTMFVRQAFAGKIRGRIQTHNSYESLYEVFPKDILPKEYGGKEKTVPELTDDLLNVVRSENFMKYCEEMRKATTDEKKRNKTIFNEEYMGIPGTFRRLNVD